MIVANTLSGTLRFVVLEMREKEIESGASGLYWSLAERHNENPGLDRAHQFSAKGIFLHIRRKILEIKRVSWMLLGLIGIATMPAQAAPKSMIATVINEHFSPPRPVEGIEISISYIDSSEKITTSQKRTGPDGQTELMLSSDAANRDDLHIEIADAPGLVIYQPSEGLLSTVPKNLRIVLLPKGSPALLEPAQIEAMLGRLSRLTLQNQQLKAAIAKPEGQKPSFDESLRGWATENGFAFDDVDQRVQAWSKAVLAHKEESSLTKQAEAEFGLRHFEEAARLFEVAADKNLEALDQREKDFADFQHEQLRELFQHYSQEAKSFQLAHDFHSATLAIGKGQKKLDQERKSHPDDSGIRHLWMWASILEIGTRLKEGENGLTQDSMQIFSSAVTDCEKFLGEIKMSEDPEEWGFAQDFLGGALLYLGSRSPDLEGVELFTRAIAAFRLAVGVHDLTKDPKNWIISECMLALALAAQSARLYTTRSLENPPTAAPGMVAEAVADFRAVLAVFKEDDGPMNWADIQSSLADALSLQALEVHGPGSAGLLTQATEAEKAALATYTRLRDSDGMGIAQGNLGAILNSEGLMSSGVHAADCFSQAEVALRAAIELRKSTNDPNSRLNLQENLGNALFDHAMLLEGMQQTELLAQAVGVDRDQLRVLTKEGFPQRWAKAQDSLGLALFYEGAHTDGKDGIDLLAQSVAAYRAALEVFTRTGEPGRWASAQETLAEVLATEGQRVGGSEGDKLLADAVTAYRAALEVYRKADSPRNWGSIQRNLGFALQLRAEFASGLDAVGLYAEAIGAYREKLDVDPKDAQTESTLGYLYHEKVIDFAKAYEVMKQAEQVAPSAARKMDLAEASLTTSRFSECLDLLGSLGDTDLQATAIAAKDVIRFACQWGAREPESAKSAVALATELEHIDKSTFTTTGDRQYLSTASEFATGRPLWLRLFQELQESDSPAMAQTARELSQTLGH